MIIARASARDSDTSFHAVQRRLATLLPDAVTIGGGGTLEMAGLLAVDRPRLAPPELIEDRAFRAHEIAGEPTVRFAAFLDGTQSSRVVQYMGGVPVVHATVAAVVRTRQDSRMRTWRAPIIERRLYAPLELLTGPVRNALESSDIEIFDTMAGREVDSIHPLALQETALQAVQSHRGAVERALLEEWCAAGDGELFVDGGISESAHGAASARVVGVVKSHQQLYVQGDDLHVVLSLRGGERTSVVRVTSRRRTPVASWYLRLRSAPGHDPLWGLVRVEVADVSSVSEATARANEVSRWILAEALPLAVPDGRWDKMVYGIRDCEEFLRSIQ